MDNGSMVSLHRMVYSREECVYKADNVRKREKLENIACAREKGWPSKTVSL